MPNHEKANLFEAETLTYLYNSFKKVGLDEENVDKIVEWLGTAPSWTTIRVNTHLFPDVHEAIGQLQDHMKKDFSENSYEIECMPKYQVLSDLINDCVVLKLDKINILTTELPMPNKRIIVDMKCGQAVLRGADVFVPGIIAMSVYINKNDYVSVYADKSGKCLRGANPKVYSQNHELVFVGNGTCQIDRNDLFKNNVSSGLAVQMARFQSDSYSPSFNGINKSYFYPQNIPSVLCAHVLQPEPNHLILDMCAAPGGKTTHIGTLTQNRAKIIAFDKIESKIKNMKELCSLMGLTSIECYHQDSTNIDFEKYKPESFDRILVDAPCSALGQRPLIFNEVKVGLLQSYISYQRTILSNAVKLLKPGGYMLYCTCTITVEENEGQVLWLLKTFPQMQLVSQDPYHLSGHGLNLDGLTTDQIKLIQRFGPYEASCVNSAKSVYNDTIGFFIAKFYKPQF